MESLLSIGGKDWPESSSLTDNDATNMEYTGKYLKHIYLECLLQALDGRRGIAVLLVPLDLYAFT